MIVYTPHVTDRLIFMLDLVLFRMLGLNYSIIQDVKKLTEKNEPVINYSTKEIQNSFSIFPHNLLAESGIHDQKIQRVSIYENLPVFFETDKKDIPFDIFSAIFYLVSRYEEYLPFKADRHNRFPASASLAFKNNFLHIPLVNLWVKYLGEKLNSWYPGIIVKPMAFEFLPTLDIDQAWAFKNKSVFHNAGSLCKDMMKFDLKKINLRFQVLKGVTEDPFYTMPEWESIHNGLALELKVFILAGKNSEFDMIVSPTNSEWQKMVRMVSGKYQIGLHPSYSSDTNEYLIAEEKKLLESLSGKSVYISRQHFLKLRFPRTYNNLIKCGIREDYSMVYPDHAGFRASIAFPFPFYDPGKDICTELVIYPPALMDRTLKDYMRLNPSQAMETVEQMINSVKATGGLFISVWHNESLGDYGEWNGWKEVYLKIIELCRVLKQLIVENKP